MTTPTIDRRQLVRYPLGTHPALLLTLVPMFAGMVVLYYLVSTSIGQIAATAAPGQVPWWFEAIYARPLVGLGLGVAGGFLAVSLTRAKQSMHTEVRANAYFMPWRLRLKYLRDPFQRGNRLSFIGEVILPLLVVGACCVLVGANPRIAAYAFIAVYFLGWFPVQRAIHEEILRRRRIALAWEGIDPPNDRLSSSQVAQIVAFSVLMIAILLLLAYFGFQIATEFPDSSFDPVSQR